MRIVIAQHATREETLFVTDAGDAELVKIIERWEAEVGRNLAVEGTPAATRDVRYYAVADLDGSKPAMATLLERIKAAAPAWFETIEGFVGETADYVQGLVTRTGVRAESKAPDIDEIATMTPGERRLHLIALLKALGNKADTMGMLLTDDAVAQVMTHIVGDLDAVNDQISNDGWRKLLGLGE